MLPKAIIGDIHIINGFAHNRRLFIRFCYERSYARKVQYYDFRVEKKARATLKNNDANRAGETNGVKAFCFNSRGTSPTREVSPSVVTHLLALRVCILGIPPPVMGRERSVFRWWLNKSTKH